MTSNYQLKFINDPIYGSVTVSDSIIFELINHRYFQRLRRILQMGMSILIFPGAHHTRFEHAIGTFCVMQRILEMLALKKVLITQKQHLDLLIAALLHDLGHGPFSHATETIFFDSVKHEELSIAFIKQIAQEIDYDFTDVIKLLT